LERLWSPWRLAYVTASGEPRGCVFCQALSRPDEAGHIVFRGQSCCVVLNVYPYNSGHLLILPCRHIAAVAETTPAERAELMDLIGRAELALGEVYRPQGLNVGLNLGRSAGAGIVDHLHVHVVPRWTGDTNFVSVVGQVRVLPEELEETAARLRPVFERLARGER
jgi:ATP adenylyltransferase